MNRNVIIIGASGHGKVIADIIIRNGHRVTGFLDDNPELSDIVGCEVLGKVSDYKKYADQNSFVIAIGNAKIRERIATELAGRVQWYTAIHPTAVISELGAKVGEGTVIMANAVVNADATIGKHCIINTGAIVEHDNRIEDFAHISVGAKLAGSVHIGKSTWVGIGTIVNNNSEVCSDCLIGAGAVIVKDIRESGVYVGAPARRLK